MAKPVKRNRKPINTVNFLNIPEGIYLIEKNYGDIKALEEVYDENHEKMYVYKGTLHKGQVLFATGKNLKMIIPEVGYNHGWTLEGDAASIFEAKNALNITSYEEHRIFCYNNKKSKLTFVGDPEKEYELHIHFYDDCHGIENHRWVVIWAKTL